MSGLLGPERGRDGKRIFLDTGFCDGTTEYAPTDNGQQFDELIEKFEIEISRDRATEIITATATSIKNGVVTPGWGKSTIDHRIAGCRAVVASVFGDEVDEGEG